MEEVDEHSFLYVVEMPTFGEIAKTNEEEMSTMFISHIVHFSPRAE